MRSPNVVEVGAEDVPGAPTRVAGGAHSRGAVAGCAHRRDRASRGSGHAGPLGAPAGWMRVLVRKTKTQLGLPSVGGRPQAQQGRSSGAGVGVARAQAMGKGGAVGGGGATERQRGGRSEAEEDLEDCARKVQVDGDGDFFGPCVCIRWERDKADVGWPGWCALVVPEAMIRGR